MLITYVPLHKILKITLSPCVYNPNRSSIETIPCVDGVLITKKATSTLVATLLMAILASYAQDVTISFTLSLNKD